MTHPKTTRLFTEREILDLRRTVAIKAETRRNLAIDPTYASPIPREVSMQLTYKCNLRCTHCFQWNEEGFFHSFDSQKKRTELDVSIIADVLAATESTNAKVFLWGGEPLMHTKFGEIADLLSNSDRIVNMCTNGLLMERNADALLRIGAGLNLLVSLDGFKEGHEALRGRGSYDRTMRNVEHFIELQKAGRFEGEISVACMVSDAMVDQMYDFTAWAEQAGFNSIYWLFPWYISPAVAEQMDEMYAAEFGFLGKLSGPGTWHSYAYRLPAEKLSQLNRSMTALAERSWQLRIRYQPQLEADEVADFVNGTSRPAQNRSRCLALSNRVEVHADGSVSSCKFFPEFIVGNLNDTPMLDLWGGETFTRVRQSMRATGLMPVCSKCILLYLNGE